MMKHGSTIEENMGANEVEQNINLQSSPVI
jgi:hypothetical protein